MNTNILYLYVYRFFFLHPYEIFFSSFDYTDVNQKQRHFKTFITINIRSLNLSSDIVSFSYLYCYFVKKCLNFTKRLFNLHINTVKKTLNNNGDV